MVNSLADTEEKTPLGEQDVRRQLDLVSKDQGFATSRRSVAFLRYVVEQTLEGSAELLKERTIGVEVFGRDPSYDTGGDHIVRTSATELRKRLAIYYGDERHKTELRIGLLPGSYVPKFAWPVPQDEKIAEFPSLSLEPMVPALSESIEPQGYQRPGDRHAGGAIQAGQTGLPGYRPPYLCSCGSGGRSNSYKESSNTVLGSGASSEFARSDRRRRCPQGPAECVQCPGCG